jgi:hypothetical protein
VRADKYFIVFSGGVLVRVKIPVQNETSLDATLALPTIAVRALPGHYPGVTERVWIGIFAI